MFIVGYEVLGAGVTVIRLCRSQPVAATAISLDLEVLLAGFIESSARQQRNAGWVGGGVSIKPKEGARWNTQFSRIDVCREAVANGTASSCGSSIRCVCRSGSPLSSTRSFGSAAGMRLNKRARWSRPRGLVGHARRGGGEEGSKTCLLVAAELHYCGQLCHCAGRPVMVDRAGRICKR